MLVGTRDQVGFSRHHGHSHKNRENGRPEQNSGSGDRFEFHSHGKPGKGGDIHFGNATNGAAPAAPVRNEGPYYDATADAAASKAYYGGGAEVFAGQDGDQLYATLNKLVTSTHHPLPYKPDNYLYPQVDRHPDGNLYCIYSDQGPMFTGDGTHNGQPMNGNYNCEHVVPQSWFDKKATPRGDLHHLFAAEMHCNSIRGNATLSDFVINGTSGYQMAEHGALDPSHNEFSPQGGKGDVARATLYFMMRYPGEIGDNENEYSAKDIPMLVKFAQEDPPSEYEKHRNASIQKLQGNRNPLVDFPELVGKVDFLKGLGHVRVR